MSKGNEDSNSKNAKLGVLSVDVIGYGDGSANNANEVKKDNSKS